MKGGFSSGRLYMVFSTELKRLVFQRIWGFFYFSILRSWSESFACVFGRKVVSVFGFVFKFDRIPYKSVFLL
jgi:hypothetical protein